MDFPPRLTSSLSWFYNTATARNPPAVLPLTRGQLAAGADAAKAHSNNDVRCARELRRGQTVRQSVIEWRNNDGERHPHPLGAHQRGLRERAADSCPIYLRRRRSDALAPLGRTA